MLVIIFSNKSYFCFNHRNNFFSGTSNYFSNVYQELFFDWARIIFHGIANLFFGLQCIAGLAFEVDWFDCLSRDCVKIVRMCEL